MNFGNVKGEMVSWGERLVCMVGSGGRAIVAVGRDKVGPFSRPLDRNSRKWDVSLLESRQATAVIVCPNAVVVGRGDYPSGEPGRTRGFVRILSADSGQTLDELALDAPVTYNGLAVAGGKLYATLEDGAAVCLGADAAGKRAR